MKLKLWDLISFNFIYIKGSGRQKIYLSRNRMVCVLSCGLLYRIKENLIVSIAFYSLGHLNKHFRSYVEKFEKTRTIIFKNPGLLPDITILFF